jgi:hypothetical protein
MAHRAGSSFIRLMVRKPSISAIWSPGRGRMKKAVARRKQVYIEWMGATVLSI